MFDRLEFLDFPQLWEPLTFPDCENPTLQYLYAPPLKILRHFNCKNLQTKNAIYYDKYAGVRYTQNKQKHYFEETTHNFNIFKK